MESYHIKGSYCRVWGKGFCQTPRVRGPRRARYGTRPDSRAGSQDPSRTSRSSHGADDPVGVIVSVVYRALTIGLRHRVE